MSDLRGFWDKAYAYKKTRLWQRVWEDMPFALRLQDGRVGYVSVMGRLGQHCALALYIGQAGLDAYTLMHAAEDVDEVERILRMTGSECLQAVLEDREHLPEDYRQEVLAYARERGLRLTGQHNYAVPLSCRANTHPVLTDDGTELALIGEALDAAVWAAGHLDEMRLRSLDELDDHWPLLERAGDGYRVGTITAPWPMAVTYPSGDSWDERLLSRVTALRPRGTWPMRLARILQPMPVEGDERLHFPVALIAVRDSEKKLLLEIEPVPDYEHHPDILLNRMMEAMLAERKRPAAITVSDERTQELLARWCLKAGVALTREAHTEADEAALAFMNFVQEQADGADDEPLNDHLLIGFCDMLLESPGFLASLSPDERKELFLQMRFLSEDEDAPDELRDKSRLVLQRMEEDAPAARIRPVGGAGTAAGKSRANRRDSDGTEEEEDEKD